MDVKRTPARELSVIGPIIEDLLDAGLACAPHVVARLTAALTDDLTTIRAVAECLDGEQRSGLRPLPCPLPLVDPIIRQFAHLDPARRDRELLFAASVRLDDRLAPLLDFDGRTVHELLDAPIAPLLDIRAGRLRMVDPRLSTWVVSTTPASMAADVHLRLHDVFLARGEQADASWHRARASVHGVPEIAAALVRVAQECSDAGSADRAVMIAGEAAAHGTGADREEALLTGGISSIAAGYAAEAVDRLSELFPDGEEYRRVRGLGILFLAQAHLQGCVPEADLDAVSPRGGDPLAWYEWARAAAYAAIMSAERGDRRAMRSWLETMRDACTRAGYGRDLRDPVVALAWLLMGERDVEPVPGEGPLTGGMLRALLAALDGDVDHGLRLIAAGDAGLGIPHEAFVSGCERSPLVAAYRAVAHVLLLTWRGDIAAARDTLLRAALDLPVALPFDGLGVVLARRLDLAVIGHIGPFARALTAALPLPSRGDQIVDRAVEAFLAGASEEAVACMRLWRDRGAPQPVFSVPGLEEVAAAIGMRSAAQRRSAPPEAASVGDLCMRISACTDREWPSEYPRIVASIRSIGSAFSRGRLEAMIGTRSLIRGEDAAGHAHLDMAQRLFELCGADAWARAVAERLRRSVSPDHRPSAASANPVAAARRLWEPILTARELEVAMLAVGGASNREIAARLHLSVRTVEVHLGRVFAKLEVRSRVELTVLAHRIDRFA